jgi:2-dehydro-3-deoxygluconokinase
VLHLSGITPALSASCFALVEALLDVPRDGLCVSFDVNLRPALWGGRDLSMLAGLAARADIVLTGDDEARHVWGTGDPAELRALLPGPHTVVVKHGERGATLVEGGAEPLFAPALRVDVVEPVGAGDAFAAGFLAATLRGAAPMARLRQGHLQAAVALLTHDDVGVPLARDVVDTLLRAGPDEWRSVRLTGKGVVLT